MESPVRVGSEALCEWKGAGCDGFFYMHHIETFVLQEFLCGAQCKIAMNGMQRTLYYE